MNTCPVCQSSSKDIKTKCKLCEISLCSISCLLKHSNEYHYKKPSDSKGNLLLSLKKKNSQSLTEKFPFISEGTILSSPCYSNEYSFDNFSLFLRNCLPIQLGSGSYGRVFLMKNLQSNKFVAVKTMDKKKISQSCGSLDLLYNEINIHSRLIHKNIIRMYNFFEDNNCIKIMMEYANRGNVYEWMKHNKSGLSEKEAFNLFIQVVSAIVFLHDNDIIHRDIKPENLLLNDDVLKLCDFGWSREINITKRTTFCGTVEYMAPEIVNNENYNKEIDIWSLGILLYELIHGKSPFVDKNTRKIVIKIKENKFIFFKNTSVECKDLIMKLLEPNSDKRLKARDILNHPFISKYAYELHLQPKMIEEDNMEKKEINSRTFYKSRSMSRYFEDKPQNAIEEVKELLLREKYKAKDEIGNISEFNNEMLCFEDFRDSSENILKKNIDNLESKKKNKKGIIEKNKHIKKLSLIEELLSIKKDNDDKKKKLIFIKQFSLVPEKTFREHIKVSNKENYDINLPIKKKSDILNTKLHQEHERTLSEENDKRDTSYLSKFLRSIF